VAEFLAKDPFVAYVYYPGLESHPQHEEAKRQFGDYGYGGMLAFAVEGDGDTQNRFVSNLRVITSAVSLGHDESLIVHVGPEGRGGWERYPESFRHYGHLRFSIGLEDPADLIADLSSALDATFG
jgi:methionine-gamma-lyase